MTIRSSPRDTAGSKAPGSTSPALLPAAPTTRSTMLRVGLFDARGRRRPSEIAPHRADHTLGIASGKVAASKSSEDRRSREDLAGPETPLPGLWREVLRHSELRR